MEMGLADEVCWWMFEELEEVEVVEGSADFRPVLAMVEEALEVRVHCAELSMSAVVTDDLPTHVGDTRVHRLAKTRHYHHGQR